jgi:hypothetical protein
MYQLNIYVCLTFNRIIEEIMRHKLDKHMIVTWLNCSPIVTALFLTIIIIILY